MKLLQQFSIAVVLSLLFSASALAGEIGMPKAPPPPPDTSSATTPGTMGMPGDIPIGYASSDSVAITTLGLLQTFLSVI
jgi:hypothetical protein